MCGRYAAFREAQDLAQEFAVEGVSVDVLDREAAGNVAPTDGVRVILDRAPKEPDASLTREMHLARWGLVPSWAKAIGGAPMFNARLETLATKPAFAKSLGVRRCVVPADGYYEWLTHPLEAGAKKPTKTPFFIHSEDGASLAFAGLYSWWRDASKEDDDPARWVLSTTIVTTAARDGLEAIHDREPVVLPTASISGWLNPLLTSPDEALGLLDVPPPPLIWHEVSTRVGSVRNNDHGLISAV